MVDARTPLDAEAARGLLALADTVRATVGTRRVERPAADPEALALLLGRSGTLRAPVLRVGRVVYAGFPREGYPELAP